jgi:hypothetical protein
MISMATAAENPAILERIAREMYDDYRVEMISQDHGVFLLPWSHEGNEYQRDTFRKYAKSVCKAIGRINDGENARPTPQALVELDKNPIPSGDVAAS